MSNMLLNNLSECHKFISGIAGFIKWCIIIIAADLWLVVRSVIVVCTIHKAAGGTTMKHIHVDRNACIENGIQFPCIFFRRNGMMLFTPPVKPGRVPLRYEERPLATMVCFYQRFYSLRIAY